MFWFMRTFLDFRFSPRGELSQELESSSAGEFHPHALTEPHVNLSIHRALIVQLTPKQSTSAQTGLADGV